MPSRVVDQVWHAHILFTQEYTEFCNRIIGTYVHHQPTTTSVVKQGVREFGEIYESYFGPQPKLWVSAYADCGSCVSCGAFKPPLPTDNTSDSDISDVTS